MKWVCWCGLNPFPRNKKASFPFLFQAPPHARHVHKDWKIEMDDGAEEENQF
jgi:hypothetical protein